MISTPLLELSLNYPISKYSVSNHVRMCPVGPMMCFGVEKSRDDGIGPVKNETSPALQRLVLSLKIWDGHPRSSE